MTVRIRGGKETCRLYNNKKKLYFFPFLSFTLLLFLLFSTSPKVRKQQQQQLYFFKLRNRQSEAKCSNLRNFEISVRPPRLVWSIQEKRKAVRIRTCDVDTSALRSKKPPGCIFSLFPLSLPPPILFLSIFFLFSDADFLTGLPRYPSVPAEIYAEEEDAEREREAKKKKKKGHFPVWQTPAIIWKTCYQPFLSSCFLCPFFKGGK